MSAVQGIIAAINFRQINKDGTPDQYEKTHRVDIMVNGIQYGAGSVKPSPRGELQLRVQKGKDWVSLEAGDEVQFFTKSREYNGKTYTDKEGKISLVTKGNGQAPAGVPAAATPPASAPRPVASATSQAHNPDAMQARITAGMYLNNAVALIASGQFGLADGVKAVAYVKQLHAVASGTAPVQEAPAAVQPAVKAQPESVQDNYPDDDLPF